MLCHVNLCIEYYFSSRDHACEARHRRSQQFDSTPRRNLQAQSFNIIACYLGAEVHYKLNRGAAVDQST